MAKGQMAADKFTLGPRPAMERAQELWLQHVAGFILFEEVRAYAIGQIDKSLELAAKAAALKAVDNTMYGLMMVLDGVTGRLRNAEYEVSLQTVVRLSRVSDGSPTENVVQLDLSLGDGMCMGYHMWLDGDFGEDPVTEPEHK